MSGNLVEEDPEEGTLWWEAEKVVDSRIDKFGRREYKIRWVGFSEEGDTWEPEENLADSLYELAEEYNEKFPLRKRKDEPALSEQKPSKKQKSFTPDRAPWTLPQGTSIGSSLFSLGNLSLDALCNRPDTSSSFATYYFGKRIVIVEVPFRRTATVPPKLAKLDGYTLELLSSHYPNEGSTGKNMFVRAAKSVRCTYVATSGPALTTVSLKETLESIADFGALSPHKAKARLELLDSGTNEGVIISDLTTNDFILAKEECNLGCGFIPIDMLPRILGKKATGMSIIQVRVISPQMGVFKGVLCPKRNITQIELPLSMQKVKPSNEKQPADWVCLIVKNIFPTNRSIQIGRELDPMARPSMSCFKHDGGPGEMVERLWQSLGVSSQTCKNYAKRCKTKHSIAGLKHAYLVGVADPTGELPKGHVFVPGMGREGGRHEKLFITRSPCVEPSDGRLVSVVTTKPKRMSASNWKWISSFPFGSVIFGPPRGQTVPLPQLIANGDLDGDCYFVCWDDDVVDSIPERPVRPANLKEESKLVHKSETPKGEDWLSAAQDVMLDIELFSTLNHLKGKLWGAAKRQADSSHRFMNDRLAIQFARAYKLSLDLPKHGGLLFVPNEVRKKLPRSLHSVLSPRCRQQK